MNKIKSNFSVIDGWKANKNNQIRANMRLVNDISDYLGNNEKEIVAYITFFSKSFCYLERATNKLIKPLDDIFAEIHSSEDHKMISKLIEIKAIVPSKDKTEYLLNPWIANHFDESNFRELMSLFPDIDIPKLELINGGKED